MLDKEISTLLIEIDPTYQLFRRKNGTILVKLKKSLYGLRQAGANWYKEVSESLIHLGYTPTHTDPCLFTKREGSFYSIIGLYVDDCIYFGNNPTWQTSLRKLFKEKYQVTKFHNNDLSYLGLNITNKPEQGYTSIDQIVYIKTILDRYGLKYKDFKARSSRINTPSTPEFFSIEETIPVLPSDEQQFFRSTIMALLYVAKRTRPDILFETIFLTSRNGKATDEDQKKLDRVMCYLASTPTRKMEFWRTESTDISIDIFADASHMVHADMKGHTGCIIMLNGNLIYTSSKKQMLLAESSCEAELYAAHHAGHMAKWISNLFHDMRIPIRPIRILQDNQSTMKLVDKGHGHFGRTKHIQKRYFSIKEIIDRHIAILVYLPTELMVADLLTKPLAYNQHSKFVKAIMQGLMNVTDLISKGSVGYLSLNKIKDARSQAGRLWAIKDMLGSMLG
jgi:hypothetical protein